MSADVDSDTRCASIQHFSLMNSLLAVLNSSEHDSTENVLACYFLGHFDCLKQLNVYEVAAECFTTRSGIRRFCQSIGLENFSDLKSYSWEWDRHSSLFIGYADHPDYRSFLTDSIRLMTEQVNRLVSDDDLDCLAQSLHDAERVIILTSDFSSMAIRQFQQSMLYLHKIVHVITDSSGDISGLGTLGAADFLIVISEHGNYAHAVRPMLEGSTVPKALVTLDGDHDLDEYFDQQIRLTDGEKTDERTVYAHYGVSFLFELLYNRYLVKYGNAPVEKANGQ